jgi:hypothetical protein
MRHDFLTSKKEKKLDIGEGDRYRRPTQSLEHATAVLTPPIPTNEYRAKSAHQEEPT